MTFLKRLLYRLKSLARSRGKERDLDDELRYHLEMAIEENEANGMKPRVARREALREFGNAELLKEGCRDAWGVRLLGIAARDFKSAGRLFLRSGWTSAFTVLVLGMCIGGNLISFGLINSFLIKPYPYPEEDKIVMVWHQDNRSGDSPLNMSIPIYKSIIENDDIFENAALYTARLFNIATSGDGANLVQGLFVTPSYFETIGMEPYIGRGFRSEEVFPGNDDVVILSHEYWKSNFGSDPSALGTFVEINGTNFEIIGVMPEDHMELSIIPSAPSRSKVLLPYVFEARYAEKPYAHRHWLEAQMVGRLRGEIDANEAEIRIKSIYERVRETLPENIARYEKEIGFLPRVYSLREDQTRGIRKHLYLLQGAFLLLLLLGSLNVSGLLVSFNNKRMGELAMRSSLGVSRGRMAFLFLMEGLWVGVGSVGFAFACVWLIGKFNNGAVIVGQTMISGIHVLDWGFPVLGFGCAVLVVFVLWIGSMSFGQYRGVKMQAFIGGGLRTASMDKRSLRLGSALVVAQVTVTLVLLVATGLFAKNLMDVLRIDVGFEVENVHTARFYLEDRSYTDEQQISYINALEDRLERVPGVESVGIINNIPFSGPADFLGIQETGSSRPMIQAYEGVSNADFFNVMGLRLLKGRLFETFDVESAMEVAIIDEQLEKELFPAGDSIGKIVRTYQGNATVVGVVSDIKITELEKPRPCGTQYRYYKQETPFWFGVTVKMSEGWKLSEAVFAQAISEVDPGIGSFDYKSMKERMSDVYRYDRMLLSLSLFLSFLAIALSVVGIYGLFSNAVEHRAKEFGIRTALGAPKALLLKQVMFRGGGLLLIGLMVGVLGAGVVAQMLQRFLYRANTFEPMLYLLSATLIAIVAVVASYLPTWRVLSTAPMGVLKRE